MCVNWILTLGFVKVKSTFFYRDFTIRMLENYDIFDKKKGQFKEYSWIENPNVKLKL